MTRESDGGISRPMRYDQAAYTSLVPWFGAKRTLAPRIIPLIGRHRAYFEPFCGSMAVLLAKDPVSTEVANDLHGDLVNLARVIRDVGMSCQLYWKLRRTPPVEAFFLESRAIIRGADPIKDVADVERAYHYFLSSWLGMNGLAGTRPSSNGFSRRFTTGGGDSGVRFIGAVESVPWWHERMRGVQVWQMDGITLCEKVEDREGTVVYADPPYLNEGHEYLHGFTPADHERLAAALCAKTKTRVLVSYYDDPRLDTLYPGWTKILMPTTKGMTGEKAKRKPGAVKSPEVLLLNFDPGQPAKTDLFGADDDAG